LLFTLDTAIGSKTLADKVSATTELEINKVEAGGGFT